MLRLALSLLGVLALALPVAADAATTGQKTPFDIEFPICNGDVVHLTGTLLITSSVTTTPSGGLSAANHYQPQGISGVDETTGVKYNAVGLTRDDTVVTPAGGAVLTSINRFHLQATRGEDSYIVSTTFHVTLTPNGDVTAFVDNFTATC